VQTTLPFWLHLPGALRRARAAGQPDTQRWPLLVFLHGSGERGEDLQRVKAHGPPKWLDAQPDFPAIVVSPQAPTDGGWDPHLLHALLGQLQTELPIDADRVTATGLSMGGRGVWAWAIAYPQDLAAIAPVCGEGDEDRVCRIRHLPVWGFHGEDDTVVRIADHRAAIQALRDCGGQAHFTAYPGVGHNAWDPAYADPALVAWLLAQRRHLAR
jgi:predicted peptidase